MYFRHPGLSRFSLPQCRPCATDETAKLENSQLAF